jgi:p25-alpha
MTTPRGSVATGGSMMGTGCTGSEPMMATGGGGAPHSRSPAMATMDPLQLKFIAFAVFGKGQAAADQAAVKPKAVLMDSKGFAKLCKESKIMSGRLDLTRVDLCFTKACDRVRSLMQLSAPS